MYLLSAATFGFEDYMNINFDGLVQFPPHSIQATEISHTLNWLNPKFNGYVFDYESIAANAIASIREGSNTHPCVMTAWDNVARKNGSGHVFHNCSPAKYKKWLKDAFEYVSNTDITENIVFINAWNEWAEGTYLEPDRKYGYAYLNATANVIRESYRKEGSIFLEIERSQNNFEQTSDTALALHLYYEDLFEDLFCYIEKIKEIDIFISLPYHVSSDTVMKIRKCLPKAYLELHLNQGRDIAPFLKVLDIIHQRKYRYIGKVHSKKTTYREDGSRIRRHLIDTLLSTPKVELILQKMRTHSNIGMVAPSGSIFSLSNPDYAVNNFEHLNRLMWKIGGGTLGLKLFIYQRFNVLGES